DDRINQIVNDVADVNKEHGVKIEVIVVDSSPDKPSAFKLK
ncbi:MAG: hypothetical protein JWO31_1245, partial [Phycisphaerales bacterium]|nr:hypothetical protein [Phycisphaerales bacterium]